MPRLEPHNPPFNSHSGIYTASQLAEMPLKQWLDEICIASYKNTVSDPDNSQITAWEEEKSCLKKAFSDAHYEPLTFIFEYAMPQYEVKYRELEYPPAVRADAIILEATTVIVIEFKRKRGFDEKYLNQATKYANRLKKYHAASSLLDVKTIYCSTHDRDILIHPEDERGNEDENVIYCSGELIGEAANELLPRKLKKHGNIQGWVGCEFQRRPSLYL